MKTEVTMTLQEADRYALMKQIASEKITIVEASQVLGISYRQTKRIWARYKREGAKGLISKQRGRASHHQLPSSLKAKAIDLIEKNYHDYGPTLVREKLIEKHDICMAKETLRQLMMLRGIWKAKKKKKKRVYARRTRRSRVGELVQIDGSYEYWFEDRAEKCCLLVFVDDATSQIMAMRFCRTETTDDYFAILQWYLEKHGRPRAFYSDKHSIFRVNMKGCSDHSTTFHKALQKLDIELICAHSPQAKGRVERANGVLQDRLIKELREEKISSMEEGNRYLEKYRKKHNKQFGKAPADDTNAHRQLLPSQNLSAILLETSSRVLSKDLSFSYGNELFQIDSMYKNRLSGKKVDIYVKEGAIVYVEVCGKRLSCKKWKEHAMERPQIIDTKELEVHWPTRKRKPGKYHPWR